MFKKHCQNCKFYRQVISEKNTGLENIGKIIVYGWCVKDTPIWHNVDKESFLIIMKNIFPKEAFGRKTCNDFERSENELL